MNRLIVFGALLSLLSCTGSHLSNNPRSVAMGLNDSAVNVMHAAAFMQSDTILRDSMLRHSLELLSQSIEVDSAYFTAASNKSVTEFKMGRYCDALSTIQKFERNCDRIISEARLLLGLCYRKTNNEQSAKLAFRNARDGFITRQDTLNYYCAKCLLEGKESVLAEIDTIPALMQIKEIGIGV